MKKRNVRLQLEELEGRCLLSSGFGPLGGITTGPDGDIWFLEKDRLGRIDPHSGIIQEFAQGINTAWPNYIGQSIAIAEAPDGSIWFLSNGQVTRFTPSTNALATFNLSAGYTPLGSLAIGPDGVVWVLEYSAQADGIARIDPLAGTIKDYTIGSQFGNSAAGPKGIGFAPDGQIWITSWFNLKEMDPATGVVQDVVPFKSNDGPPPMPPGSTSPPWYYYVPYSKVASDGSYWSAVVAASGYAGGYWEINGYYSSTGAMKGFPVNGFPMQLTPGPDGNIWFTYSVATVIGVVNNNFVYSMRYFVGELNPSTGVIESFSQATQAPPSSTGSTGASGKTLAGTASSDIVAAVASFTPQTSIASPGQAYQVTVNWGDGTTSSLVLTVSQNGTYDIIGEHTYHAAGTYTIKVTIGNFDPANPLGDNPITVFSTANIDPFYMNM